MYGCRSEWPGIGVVVSVGVSVSVGYGCECECGICVSVSVGVWVRGVSVSVWVRGVIVSVWVRGVSVSVRGLPYLVELIVGNLSVLETFGNHSVSVLRTLDHHLYAVCCVWCV